MQTFTQLLEAWGLAFVVLNVLADQSGLPVPSYPTLIAASALAPQAGYSPVQVAVLAVISALVADAAWYVAGLRKGRSVLCGLCRASRMPDACVRSTESAFLRFGLPSLLVVKFLPGFSALSATLAGATRMSPARYFAVDIGERAPTTPLPLRDSAALLPRAFGNAAHIRWPQHIDVWQGHASAAFLQCSPQAQIGSRRSQGDERGL